MDSTQSSHLSQLGCGVLSPRTPLPPPRLSVCFRHCSPTYDHTHQTAWDPVRSPLNKLVRAKSVVGSVTTSESLVLYVFFSRFPPQTPPPISVTVPTPNHHIRPYPRDNTGSRPLSPRQTRESRTSSWVGDHQRILGVVCFCFCSFVLPAPSPLPMSSGRLSQRSWAFWVKQLPKRR